MRTPAVVVALLFLGGCSGSGDGAPPGDGGHDASAGDLGGSDAGAGTDAGGGDDLGPGTDGGANDGAPMDAPTVDLGVDMGPVSMPCTPMGVCDPFDPASCPAGQTCLPVASGGNACSMLATTVHLRGEACTGSNTCEPGTMCLDFGTGLTCHALCAMGSIGACGTGEDRCYGTISASGDACVQVCLPRAPPCDIYTQDCADSTQACAFATDPETRAPYTGCRPNGTANDGETCGSGTYCMRGMVCIRESGVATCHHVCGPDGGTPACPSPQVCTGFAPTWGVPYCRAM